MTGECSAAGRLAWAVRRDEWHARSWGAPVGAAVIAGLTRCGGSANPQQLAAKLADDAGTNGTMVVSAAIGTMCVSSGQVS